MNIVETISSQFTGGNLNKVSSILGESPARTQSAVGAIVPSLLGGLTHSVSTPEGAQRLDNAVSQTNPDDASNIPATGAEASSANIFGSLMGTGVVNTLASVLSRFTGMNPATISKFFGMVAPVTLGSLAKVKKEQGLDASGLAGFLNGQKQNITAAMPPELSNMLGSIPGGFAPKAAAEKVEEPALAQAGAPPAFAGRSSGEAGSHRGVMEQRRPSGFLILWLIIIALIIWALWASRRPSVVPPNQNPAPPAQGVTH